MEPPPAPPLPLTHPKKETKMMLVLLANLVLALLAIGALTVVISLPVRLLSHEQTRVLHLPASTRDDESTWSDAA